jgi:hypothetical protein
MIVSVRAFCTAASFPASDVPSFPWFDRVPTKPREPAYPTPPHHTLLLSAGEKIEGNLRYPRPQHGFKASTVARTGCCETCVPARSGASYLGTLCKGMPGQRSRPSLRSLTNVLLEFITELSIEGLGKGVVPKKVGRGIFPCQWLGVDQIARTS